MVARQLIPFKSDNCDVNLYDDSAYSYIAIVFADGRSIRVSVETDSGFFVLREFASVRDDISSGDGIFLTSDQHRIVDFILSQLPRDADETSPMQVGAIVSELVGHPIDEVERHLVVRTFHLFSSDRDLAARVLGTTPDELSRKLRSYLTFA